MKSAVLQHTFCGSFCLPTEARGCTVCACYCSLRPLLWRTMVTWGRYHGGRRPSCDDSFHSPTVIPPSALDKPSIMKRYHRRRTRLGVTARSPMMVTLHDARFVECRWWNDGWTENCRHLTVVGFHDTGPWSDLDSWWHPSVGAGGQ